MEQKLVQIETDLAAANLQNQCLKSALGLFKNAESYPVVQANGHVVDFHQVLMAWHGKPDEEGHNPHRTYGCPITSSYTNLAPFPVISQIQSLATALGLRLEPPMVFEIRPVVSNNDEGDWTPLSMRTQIQLSARLCSLYANRKRCDTKAKDISVVMTEEEQLIITFCMERKVCLHPPLSTPRMPTA